MRNYVQENEVNVPWTVLYRLLELYTPQCIIFYIVIYSWNSIFCTINIKLKYSILLDYIKKISRTVVPIYFMANVAIASVNYGKWHYIK